MEVLEGARTAPSPHQAQLWLSPHGAPRRGGQADGTGGHAVPRPAWDASGTHVTQAGLWPPRATGRRHCRATSRRAGCAGSQRGPREPVASHGNQARRHRTGSPHSGHPGGRAVAGLGTRLAPSGSAWPPSPRCRAPLLPEPREACPGRGTPGTDWRPVCGGGGQQRDLDSCQVAIFITLSISLSSSRNVTHSYSLVWDVLLLHHTLTHSLVGGKASPGAPHPLPRPTRKAAPLTVQNR